jgi:hypothetical protein
MEHFTGPGNCAECESALTVEIALAGGAVPAAVGIRGHQVEIPGLYRCKGCHVAVLQGMRESRVTLESAAEWLDGTYGPTLVGFILETGDEAAANMAAGRLADVMEVQIVLEAVIELQREPGGLDFIPECGRKDAAPHPRSVAHLN